MLFEGLSCFVLWATKLTGGISSYVICGSILAPSGEESGVGGCQVWVTVSAWVYSRVALCVSGFFLKSEVKIRSKAVGGTTDSLFFR